MAEPFYFYTRFNLVKLLGLKAANPVELLEGIKKVPVASIYYHTHRYLQRHHYLSPEPPNDFAYWLQNILNIKELGEAFASVDIVSFKDMEKVRDEFIRILTKYVSGNRFNRYCLEGQEFHFVTCLTFIVPTLRVAHDLNEFVDILGKISINSLYFHVFESKMRLKRDENDFTAWFKSLGQRELADRLSLLDPYTITLDRLRKKIMEVVKRYGTHK